MSSRSRSNRTFRRRSMKRLLTIAVLALTTISLVAQTSTTRSSAKTGTTTKKPATAARPNTNAPTKVTGEGTKTPDGLQYWDIKPGTGATALRGQKVTVHYTGWLTTGKKFDSSVDGGKPFSFTLGEG